MPVAIIGGGPGGLYAAALLKRLDPQREITVWERNAPDDTFGFGVVLSEALGAECRRGRPGDLARVTVYATDLAAYREHAPELGRIWRESAGRDYPAMAVVEVVRLWDEQAMVELDGFAVLP